MATAIKPIIGTNENDSLTGGAGHEVFSGRGGDDTINTQNGHDHAWGGRGDDTLYGSSGNDVLYGGGGPTYIDLPQLTVSEDYAGRVIFEGETAGYRNSLGSYKVDADGLIYDVTMHFPNASLQGSGGDLTAGVSESSLSLSAGDQLGFLSSLTVTPTTMPTVTWISTPAPFPSVMPMAVTRRLAVQTQSSGLPTATAKISRSWCISTTQPQVLMVMAMI